MAVVHQFDTGHEIRYKILLKQLRSQSSSASMNHYSRLLKCKGPDWGYRFRCRLQSCPRCRDMYIRSQVKAAQKRFGHLTNDELGMITIVLGATPDVNKIGEMMSKARRDLRNLVNRKRRADPDGWNNFEFLAWLETDCFDASQIGHLGSDKQTQYASFLTIFHGMNGPIWVPTLHGIIKLGDHLSRSDVCEAFERQFKFHRQVDIRSLISDFSMSQNIDEIIRYANKHEDTTKIFCIEASWDDAWINDYYSWMHQWSRGSLSVKISIKQKKSKYTYHVDNDGCLTLVGALN